MIGWSDDPDNRKNLFSVTVNGNVYAQGSFNPSTLDPLAEIGKYFESSNGENIPEGTPVTIKDSKIAPVQKGDIPFGVITKGAAIITNSAAEEWYGKYERDDAGNIIVETYEEESLEHVTNDKEITVTHEEIDWNSTPAKIIQKEITQIVKVPNMIKLKIYNSNGEEIGEREVPEMHKVKKTKTRNKLSAKFNSDLEYTPRCKRKEWHMVGLLGTVKVIKGSIVNPKWTLIGSKDNYDLYLIN